MPNEALTRTRAAESTALTASVLNRPAPPAHTRVLTGGFAVTALLQIVKLPEPFAAF